MKKYVNLALLALLPFAGIQAQKIVSGPMVCHTTMTTATIWMQLDQPAQVNLLHEQIFSFSQPTDALSENAFTVEFEIENLEPGTEYDYNIDIQGAENSVSEGHRFKTQPLWQYRTDPPKFKVALGSCTYINEAKYDRPGEPYGRGYHIFNSIADKSPDMMLWLGDNIYLREPDWSSRSGYLHRYSHTRQTPEMQHLLQTGQHYAIWDDHDFGPNDANGSWIHKDIAIEAFDLFWGNPTTGTADFDGITSAFQFNDIDFFLLDNRTHRTPDELAERETQILGKEQIEWLIDNLKYSRAPFKMVAVGGQVLNTAKRFENHAVYAEERKYLMRRIIEEKIEGVIFLTGDRHSTELSMYKADNGIEMYDLTVSPLTSKSYSPLDETNNLRVEGTAIGEQNFGILEFFGPRKERQMKISIFDSDGNELWTKTLKSFS